MGNLNPKTSSEQVVCGDGNKLEDVLNQKQSSLMGGVFKGSVNNLIKPGWYYADFSKVTDTIWTSGYGWIEVIRVSNTGSAIQRIYKLGAGSVVSQMIIRPWINNAWGGYRAVTFSAIN